MQMKSSTIGVVDIFSGPGGLGEGFSRLAGPDGKPVFEIDVSVEKDPVAHSTLKLRAFLRKFSGGPPPEYIDFLNSGTEGQPDWADLYADQWKQAGEEALNLTLGDAATAGELRRRIAAIRATRGDRVILIGGPPCQAYSLAGRGRKPAHKGYVPHPENRHLLYQEYIEVLRQLRPAAFVMENVKGMLSSRTSEGRVLDLVLKDLKAGGGSAEYVLYPLSSDRDLLDDSMPEDFIVRAENHGVPQTRHRVIIVGVRRDLIERSAELEPPRLRSCQVTPTVRDVLHGMPAVRSGLSPRQGEQDGPKAWKRAVADLAAQLGDLKVGLSERESMHFRQVLKALEVPILMDAGPRKGSVGGVLLREACPKPLRDWIGNDALTCLTHHETRGHMRSDLGRYLFAAAWSTVTGMSPKAEDLPPELAPAHGNWGSGKFRDRFRVQSWDSPASTVTCHASKDGNYFIHPDPKQCRSMTVREVARLQTFPDDYHFNGKRTDQYVQVGNAVPPYLAYQIAQALEPVLSTIFAGRSVTPALSRGPTGRTGPRPAIPA